MNKILVLGGNGFIGKALVKELSKENEIIVADMVALDEKIKNVNFKQIDFVNCKDFSEYLKGVDYVIHLISTIVPNNELLKINDDIIDNVFPTIRLLNDMAENNVKNILFVSSGGTIYGNHSMKPIKEEEKKEQICNYGIIKEMIEKYIHLFYIHKGIDYKILRLGNPYSDYVKKGKKQGLIPILLEQIMNNEEICIWGNGEEVRDYIYIDDAISAMLCIINYKGKEKIFNVGTGKGHSINDVLKIISKELKHPNMHITYNSARKCDVDNNVLNIEKIKKETKWVPQYNLKQGIKKIIKSRKGMERNIYESKR